MKYARRRRAWLGAPTPSLRAPAARVLDHFSSLASCCGCGAGTRFGGLLIEKVHGLVQYLSLISCRNPMHLNFCQFDRFPHPIGFSQPRRSHSQSQACGLPDIRPWPAGSNVKKKLIIYVFFVFLFNQWTGLAKFINKLLSIIGS